MAVLTVSLGLASRRAPGAPPWVQLYLGDVLWGMMFFALAALVWPARSTAWLTGAAIASTVAIELSQLYQAPGINAVRDTRLGGLLLGHEFSVSDVMSVTLGGLLAGALDRLRAAVAVK